MTGLFLAITVHPTHCLSIMARVPGSIKHHHAVGTDQIHAQAPGPLKHKPTIAEPLVLKMAFKPVLPSVTPSLTRALCPKRDVLEGSAVLMMNGRRPQTLKVGPKRSTWGCPPAEKAHSPPSVTSKGPAPWPKCCHPVRRNTCVQMFLGHLVYA